MDKKLFVIHKSGRIDEFKCHAANVMTSHAILITYGADGLFKRLSIKLPFMAKTFVQTIIK